MFCTTTAPCIVKSPSAFPGHIELAEFEEEVHEKVSLGRGGDVGLLCSLWVPTALGQAVYGSILGTVTDPSGAAVNGAKITVTSQTKNVSSEATTNESGNYSVTHLIPDVYTVRIEGTGFQDP